MRDADIEQQGQPRLQADHPAFERGDELQIQSPPAALIGVAGIGEAIAQHPGAAFQRGCDRLAHVLRTRGDISNSFGLRGPAARGRDSKAGREIIVGQGRSRRAHGAHYFGAITLQAPRAAHEGTVVLPAPRAASSEIKRGG